MANFDRLAEQGRAFFLRYDQREIMRRFSVEADANWIYVNFVDERLQIDRASAAVQHSDGRAAAPAAVLSVYDMLCSDGEPHGLSGAWRTTNTLPGIAQSAPDEGTLLRPWTERFARDPERLRRACRKLGGTAFPVGDIAFELRVFDWFPVVLQFWLGDEEFPSALRFLWDENALCYLHYETLYYIMMYLLERLDAQTE